MTDEDALLRAAAAAPDDDTPRLIFADWLDDHGESERAAFVRTQLDLARANPWDPLAVLCRHRRPDWLSGEPWRSTLPQLPPGLTWHPERAFRRGFGYAVVVKNLATFFAVADQLFDVVPVGELHLPAGTLADWRWFGRQPWLARVRAIRFFGPTPIEPIRVLCASPNATGLEAIEFERAGSPAVPELVAALFESPIGRQLRELHFRSGYESLEDLIDAFTAGPDLPRLRRLTFFAMGLAADGIIPRLTDSPVLDGLEELAIDYDPIGSDGLRRLARSPRLAGLKSLRLLDVRATTGGFAALAGSPHLSQLRLLEVQNPGLTAKACGRLAGSAALAGLRALRLHGCGVDAAALRQLRDGRFWPNLTELDVRQNPLGEYAAQALLSADPPADLTALAVDGGGFNANDRAALAGRYGDAMTYGGESA